MSRASLSSVLRRAGALLVLGVLGVASSGCGGFGPGDYLFFRVAFNDQAKKSSSCYPDPGVPPNIKSDKTTFRTSNTFILYGAADVGEEFFYLDTGTVSLEGILEEDVFSFTGTQTDVEWTNFDGTGDKVTTTDKVTIEFALDGTSITGDFVGVHKKSCSGNACATTLPVPENCTTTQTFVGTQVEDVQLEHGI